MGGGNISLPKGQWRKTLSQLRNELFVPYPSCTAAFSLPRPHAAGHGLDPQEHSTGFCLPSTAHLIPTDTLGVLGQGGVTWLPHSSPGPSSRARIASIAQTKLTWVQQCWKERSKSHPLPSPTCRQGKLGVCSKVAPHQDRASHGLAALYSLAAGMHAPEMVC